MESTKTYLKYYFSVTLIILIVVALINMIIDPFNVYHERVYHGYNQNKSGAWRQHRLIKAEKTILEQPNIIIIGTSRTENGLRCDHPAILNNKCLNLSMYGSNFYEQYRYFQHALNVSTIKEIVIGIDLFAFNQNRNNHEHFSEQLLSISANGQPQSPNYYAEKAKILLSIDTLKYSIRTIKKSRRAAKRDSTEQGKDDFFSYDRWRRHSDDYLNSLWFSKDAPDLVLLPDDTTSGTLHLFRQMTRQAYQHGVELKIFISPGHAWLWETLHAAGLWNEFELLKQQIVSIVEDEANENKLAAFAVWDFSGYNTVTTSAKPRRGVSENGPGLYTDPSHYLHTVGDMVLDRLFETAVTQAPDDFGVKLTHKNIDAHLRTIRQQQQIYRTHHAKLYTMIEALAEAAADKRASRKNRVGI